MGGVSNLDMVVEHLPCRQCWQADGQGTHAWAEPSPEISNIQNTGTSVVLGTISSDDLKSR